LLKSERPPETTLFIHEPDLVASSIQVYLTAHFKASSRQRGAWPYSHSAKLFISEERQKGDLNYFGCRPESNFIKSILDLYLSLHDCPERFAWLLARLDRYTDSSRMEQVDTLRQILRLNQRKSAILHNMP
jgi:hypothetical protein